MDKQQMFTDELRRISGVSVEYANAAWFTLNRHDQPITSAREYCRRFDLYKAKPNDK